MKLLKSIIPLLALIVSACQKPIEVQLLPSGEENVLEVESIGSADSLLSRQTVDSSGVLPIDYLRFAGFITLNDIKYERPDGTVLRFSYSRVLFENRLRPVLIDNKRRGFHAIPLGQVLLNNESMVPRVHWIAGTVAGTEYVKDLTASYQPNTVYTWSARPDSIGNVDASILSPDDLTVKSPKSGSRLSRNQNLSVEWTGRGHLLLIISAVGPSLELHPIFSIRVRHNQQRAIIDRKILLALPRNQHFMFTFILANREESTVVDRFPGKVLIQAASIYNTRVEFP